MNYQEQPDPASGTGSSNRLPLILGIVGAVFGAAAFGFVVANALSGGSDEQTRTDSDPTTGGNDATPVDNDATPGGDDGTPAPEATQPRASVTPRPTEPGATTVPPTATTVPPTATTVPPTATPTEPAITTPKFYHMFRAEGGQIYKSATTGLPFRRLEADWDNNYENCPGEGCVRGKVRVWTAIGPGALAESLEASSQVFNSFIAQRRDATLLMNVHWKGTIASYIGANANAGVEIEILVRQVQGGKVVKTLPGMPYEVYSEELGLEAIAGLDRIAVDDSRSVNIPLKLEPGKAYRIDLILTCKVRAALSATVTNCDFMGDDSGVEWTRQLIEYDTGTCPNGYPGDRCIYPGTN